MEETIYPINLIILPINNDGTITDYVGFIALLSSEWKNYIRGRIYKVGQNIELEPIYGGIEVEIIIVYIESKFVKTNFW